MTNINEFFIKELENMKKYPKDIFFKGDILYVNDSDKKSDGWWLARLRTSSSNQTSNQEKIKCGYIPSNYVAWYEVWKVHD